MDNKHLTSEEHLGLLCDLTDLQLSFLWTWLETHPDEEFSYSLHRRIDICRKTDPEPKHYDIARIDFKTDLWIKTEADLLEIYNSSDSADSFEKASSEYLRPMIVSFAEKTYGSTFKTEEYQCGSLKYDPPWKDDPKAVMFHIGNALAPKSIFDDPNYLKGCFLDLMNQVEKKYDADTVKTGTWLNSHPKWLEYFPQEWLDNMGPEEENVSWGFGHWGQFISAKGTFNHKLGKILRETGRFPYYPRSSRCPISEFRKKLAE
jgi:hypothetical protein